MRSPCVRCGQPLVVDDADLRVTVSLTAKELEQLIWSGSSFGALELRLTCALGLIDPTRERAVLNEANGGSPQPAGGDTD